MVGVGLDSPLSDQIPEELARSYSEGILLGVELHIEFSEESECFPQILHIAGVIEALNKHVIDIHLYFVSNQLIEDFIIHPVKSSSGVLQSEGHDFVAGNGVASGEGCLVFIF